ncbi:hypothetical protein EV44_g0262 [Erysiphe necator]|uniref:Uncharacterized protein n=1 Tax=Uncinula necator TaxID=52586 RepID=A0A0B1PEW1_UNCNE|nr:hypothetical protein EV44_g0262 [Erysiphe necator]
MNFASAAIVITLQNSVLEHFLVKTMARPCTLKILVWLLLGVETVEGLITPTVGYREFQAAARARAVEEKASEMEAIKQNLRGMGDTEATSERVEVMVEIILEISEPDEVRVNILENVKQESVSITADSTMNL